MSAAARWADDLAAWAIPPEILAAAPQSPWIHPVEMFTVSDAVPDSPSHRRAREALPDGGSVLDVGCGGGRAAMALVPPAGRVTGVDEQQRMLDRFVEAAARAQVDAETVQGGWPQVAADVPAADVVVCHHVVYNVADLVPFVRALDEHARHRVVLELPVTHPLSNLAPYWRRFWGLERPEGPTAQDALAVVREAGIDAQLDLWTDETYSARAVLTAQEQVRFLRIRLCLPESRDDEVAAALAEAGPPAPRRTATLWWDR
jgi:SAM-dependent methyltransferase